MLKIATWNVNSIRVRLPQVLDWLAVAAPDIVALQETKIVNELFPVEEFRQAGYQTICNGQKTYNGVAIISKTPASDVVTDLPTFPDPQKRLLHARYGDIAVVNLYIPNGMAVGSDKYAYKLDWLTQLQQFLYERLGQMRLLVVLGDFNIAPADEDVHDPAAWQGSVLVSPAERAHFFQFIDKGLVDCYRLFKQEVHSFTWWDYRAAGFARNHGLRIDHILASRQLAEHCKICRIDTAPRKLERPSDHAPVIAVFDL
ncbi:MAG: Exodeoxyribonuclease III [Gammaproteobacteria bacterium]|nr:Exodeoxyribonuclease III [Gammaproteobacteria bacterium]